MAHRSLPAALRDVVDRVGSADIMVGIPSHRNASTIGHVVRAAQAGLVQYFPDLRPILVNADAGSTDGTARVVVETEPPDYVERVLLALSTTGLRRVSLTYPEVDGVSGKGAAVRALLQVADALGVRALVLVDADLRSIVPEWIDLMAGPIVRGGFDLVTPLYARHRWDGTITNTVTYPVTRALYGHRIRQPIGGDVALSGDLVRALLARDDWTPDVSRFGIDIWITTSAVTGPFSVCQTRLGSKVHDPKDPGADLGPMFRQVVATLLRLALRHERSWLPVTGSRQVPAYGPEWNGDPPPLTVDAQGMLLRFAEGVRTHAAVLPGALGSEELRALRALAHLAAGIDPAARTDPADLATGGTDGRAFSFPDDLWARIVFDLLVAAHHAPADLDALVDTLAPLYLGRVASLILETVDATPDEAEALNERQALAFERDKPRLVARWGPAA